MDINVYIPCCVCGCKSSNVVELENNKGYKCYCNKHTKKTEEQYKKEILGGKYG